MRPILFVCVAECLLWIPSCTYNQDTGRVGLNHTSDRREQELGNEAMAKLRSMKMPLSTDAAAQARVQRIGSRLVSAAGVSPASVQFYLVEDKGLNAFTLPGKKIIVLSGVLNVSASDDVVAAILGHEVAHMTLCHTAEDSSNSELSTDLTMALMTPLTVFMTKEQKDKAREQARNGASAGDRLFKPLTASRDRSQEYEADAEGLRLMAKAGYAPEAAIVLWMAMADAEKKGLMGRKNYLSDHPSNLDRLRMLVKTYPNAKKLQSRG